MSALDPEDIKQREVAPRPAPHSIPFNIAPARGPEPVLPALSSTPDLLGLFSALRRRLPLALVAGLACALLAGAAAWFILPPAKYTTRATLLVAMSRPKIIFQTGDVGADYKTFQRTQIDLVKSRTKVIDRVLQDPAVSQLETVREIVRSGEDPAEWLEKQVVAEFTGNSEVLHVSMSGDRAKDIQVIVDSVVFHYMKGIVDEEKIQHKERLDALRALWARYQDDLKKKRDGLRKLAIEEGTGDKATLALKSQFAHENLSLAKSEQMHMRGELIRDRMDAASLGIIDGNGQALDPAAQEDEVVELDENDPGVVQYENRIASLVAKYGQASRLVRSKTDPALTTIARELEAARRGLADYRAAARTKARTLSGGLDQKSRDLDDARKKMAERVRLVEKYDADLTKTIERLTAEINSLNENTLDLNKEQEEIALLTEAANKVGAEVEAMNVEHQAPDRITVIDPASLPLAKDELKKAKASGLAALASFAFVLTGISFWEFRARRITTEDEVVNGLGMRLVGSIPDLKPRQTRRLSGPGGDRDRDRLSMMVESVNAIRSMLLHASRTESLRVVMVTSALEGEGKTSLSGHLATSLAASGRRTVLVDCDLRRPAAHRLFDVPEGPGICELLRGEAALADVTQESRAPGLSIITAGAVDGRALQALARGDLQAIFDALEADFDYVIVDSAPVLPVADTLVLSQHVDAVIFAILKEVSRVPMVHSAYHRLATLGVRILGAVVAGTPGQAYGSRYRLAVSV